VPVYGSNVVANKKVEAVSPDQVAVRIGAISAVLSAVASILPGIGFSTEKLPERLYIPFALMISLLMALISIYRSRIDDC
jgi:hypothetical protein